MKHVMSSFVCCGVALAAGIASADGDLEKLVDENGNFDAKKDALLKRRAAFFAVASEEGL